MLETSLDAKLALYSGLATRVASGLSASGSASGRLRRSVYGSYPLSDTSYANGDEDDVVLDMNPHAQRAQQEASEIADDENEIETLLSELSGAVMRIDELADPDGRGVASVSVQAALRRHREVLRDLENDYARLHGNVRDAQAKRDLLGNVRSDIQYVLSLSVSFLALCPIASDTDLGMSCTGPTNNDNRTKPVRTWPIEADWTTRVESWMRRPKLRMPYGTIWSINGKP